MARRLADTPLSAATQARGKARRSQTGQDLAPPPTGNTRAMRTGAQVSDGRNLATFEQVITEVREVIASEAGWLQATDGFAVESFAAELTIYKHASAAFASMTPLALSKRHKAQRVNVQRFRALNAMANDLGLTPAGRTRLGLQAAKTQAIQRVEPIVSEERARRVAEILQRQRAIPEVIDEPQREPEGGEDDPQRDDQAKEAEPDA